MFAQIRRGAKIVSYDGRFILSSSQGIWRNVILFFAFVTFAKTAILNLGRRYTTLNNFFYKFSPLISEDIGSGSYATTLRGLV